MHPANLEALASVGGMCLSRDTTLIPLKWKLRLQPGHTGILMSLNKQVGKGVTMPAWVIDPHYNE